MTEATSLPRPVAPADSGALEFRGLLHDLGHQMMTLSLLAEAVRNDTTLSAVSRQRIDLVMQEMFRIVDVITDCTADAGGPADGGRGASGGVDIRRLAAEVAQLAGVAYQTRVSLRPGRPAVLRVSGTLMWRVLANLVDNAVRAAGPDGTVEIRISQERDTVIEVVDDGPGFGGGPPGTEGLGLSVVRRLLEAEDGRLELAEAAGGGTCARVVFSLEREYRVAPMSAGTWH
ncbi:MAG TPA: ATP-binding protein [Streptosporangiaceae bacterium]|jgi:signal transduction histidine kinase|nr:ATP-binding protein [Streptosporangiaceae bacterium]